MINSIGLYQNIQYPQKLAFRAKQENAPITSPIENANLSGADALASYNSAFIKQPDMFDIPLLKPINLPNDINAIDGEKVYNSNGVLNCVVKETADKKYVYSNDEANPNIINLNIYDTKTGNKIFEQHEYIDDENSKGCWIHEYDPITGFETGNSKYYNGKPCVKESVTHNSDGSFENRMYSYNTSEYTIYGGNANGSYSKMYDVNKNLIITHNRKLYDDEAIIKYVKYKNGKEVSNETSRTQAISNLEYQKYLENSEIQPSKCPDFITNIDDIEGKKTYYSNGQLESVQTSDGKVYNISLDGHCITLQEGNKNIEFTNSDGNKHCTIVEELENATKTTTYSGKNGNEPWSVVYTKGNIEKCLLYENGKPCDYRETDLSKNSCTDFIGIEYSPSGGVLDVTENNCN